VLHGRPLAAGELAFEAIKQFVEQLYLALVQWRAASVLVQTNPVKANKTDFE
jgi:hypothetical protein